MKTIKIKLVKPTSEKLKFVKLIKECSGLGLKEAKDLCDSLHNSPHITQEMPIRDLEYDYSTGKTTPATIDYRAKFLTEIKNFEGEFAINGGTQWERDVKILKIGIGDKTDYSDFISNYILNKFDNSENLLNFALSKFSKEDLQDIFNKIDLD